MKTTVVKDDTKTSTWLTGQSNLLLEQVFKLVLFISIISVSVCVELYMCLLACLCLLRSLLCVRAFLQEVNPYSTVTSDPNELDRRYCVLKLHVPYSDLVHSPYTNNSGWDSSTATRHVDTPSLLIFSCSITFYMFFI